MSWICREWTKTAANGWTSEFSEFDTEQEAREHGQIHVNLKRYDEDERDYEVYRRD